MPVHCRMRAFDRDLIRGGHYGQRSSETAPTGRTHGCTDQRRDVKIFLANSGPSTHGTFLPFVASQHHGRYRGYRRHVTDGAGRPSLTRTSHKPDRNPAALQSPSVAEVWYPFCRKHGRHRAVKRREFITLLGGAAVAWPLAARAQQPIPLIGHLGARSFDTDAHLVIALRQGLRETGYLVGENVAVEFRWANGQYDRLSSLASELVAREVAVIVATGTADVVRAAKGVIPTILIIFSIGADPGKAGLVANLNRPNGNATGVSLLSTALLAKQLEMVCELVPTASIIAVFQNPNNTSTESNTIELNTAAAALGRRLLFIMASSDERLGHGLCHPRKGESGRTLRQYQFFLYWSPRSNCPIGVTSCNSRGVHNSGVHRGWRANKLSRRQPHCRIPLRRRLRWSRSFGRKAGGPAGGCCPPSSS